MEPDVIVVPVPDQVVEAVRADGRPFTDDFDDEGAARGFEVGFEGVGGRFGPGGVGGVAEDGAVVGGRCGRTLVGIRRIAGVPTIPVTGCDDQYGSQG